MRRALVLAVAGTALVVVLVLLNLRAVGEPVADLVHPGADGPSATVVREDFPGLELPPGLGHDGQQFYAVARAPLDLDAAADQLDRPRYRLQRPLFPLLAWALRPGARGEALVWSLFAVGVAGAVLAGTAAGVLARRLGSTPLVALAVPLLPGVVLSLRFGLADALALGLVLAAVAASLGGRTRWAVAAGVAAVLTRESTLLVLVGLALARRDRDAVAGAAVPALAAVSWAGFLALRLPGGHGVGELTWPFAGLVDSASVWAAGEHRLALVSVAAAALVGLAALARHGWRGVLSPAIALQLAFLAVLDADVLGLATNGARASLPLLVLGAVALLAPAGGPSPSPSPPLVGVRAGRGG